MTSHSLTPPLALRDTALIVTALAGGGQVVDGFNNFRRTCQTLLNRLREECIAAGHPSDVVEDAVYAQCALLDEVALGRLEGPPREAWEREPLQVAEFQTHQAGEELVARIERRLATSQPVLPLLVMFHVVLGLGFRGRFARDGADDRESLMRAIDERLAQAGMTPDTKAIIVSGDTARRMSPRSPLTWMLVALAGTGLIYLALGRWLDLSISQLGG